METSCILNTYNHYVDGLSLFKGDREIMNGEPGKRISERALSVKSKLLCKFPFDRQHGPDDLTYGR